MIVYQPDQRYAVVGKSGSGKTVFCCLLASRLVPWQPSQSGWQVWWLDTKHDPTDISMLREWGFRDLGERAATHRRIVTLTGSRQSVYEQAQIVSQAALSTGGILIVYDEYNHVCKNRIDAGPAVEDVHKRGRGLHVGSIGGVQEPVLVPRFLFSQANHLALFSLTHLRDVKLTRELHPGYAPGWPKDRPDTVPDRHGFHMKWLEGYHDEGRWRYYRHVREWDDHFSELAVAR
ncbi:MAG: hypothetical protein ACYCV4_02515 [Dermatophilaceae bacterium]